MSDGELEIVFGNLPGCFDEQLPAGYRKAFRPEELPQHALLIPVEQVEELKARIIQRAHLEQAEAERWQKQAAAPAEPTEPWWPHFSTLGTDKDMCGFALQIAVMPHPAVSGTQRGAPSGSKVMPGHDRSDVGVKPAYGNVKTPYLQSFWFP